MSNSELKWVIVRLDIPAPMFLRCDKRHGWTPHSTQATTWDNRDAALAAASRLSLEDVQAYPVTTTQPEGEK